MEPETWYTVNFIVVPAVQQGSTVTSVACLCIAQNVAMSYHTSNLNEHQVAITHTHTLSFHSDCCPNCVEILLISSASFQ